MQRTAVEQNHTELCRHVLNHCNMQCTLSWDELRKIRTALSKATRNAKILNERYAEMERKIIEEDGESDIAYGRP